MTTSCGTDTSVGGSTAAKESQRNVNNLRAAIAEPIKIFIAALREIFEEAAYDRFLNRRSLRSSPRAYRDFLRETEAAKARRPKCC